MTNKGRIIASSVIPITQTVVNFDKSALTATCLWHSSFLPPYCISIHPYPICHISPVVYSNPFILQLLSSHVCSHSTNLAYLFICNMISFPLKNWIGSQISRSRKTRFVGFVAFKCHFASRKSEILLKTAGHIYRQFVHGQEVI